jgi:hypothetical protein
VIKQIIKEKEGKGKDIGSFFCQWADKADGKGIGDRKWKRKKRKK